MSNKALNWAFHQAIKSGEKQLLVAMADMASGDTNSLFASERHLADRCSCSVDTVQRAKKKLVELGLINISRRGGLGTGRHVDRIQLNLALEFLGG